MFGRVDFLAAKPLTSLTADRSSFITQDTSYQVGPCRLTRCDILALLVPSHSLHTYIFHIWIYKRIEKRSAAVFLKATHKKIEREIQKKKMTGRPLRTEQNEYFQSDSFMRKFLPVSLQRKMFIASHADWIKTSRKCLYGKIFVYSRRNVFNCIPRWVQMSPCLRYSMNLFKLIVSMYFLDAALWLRVT